MNRFLGNCRNVFSTTAFMEYNFKVVNWKNIIKTFKQNMFSGLEKQIDNSFFEVLLNVQRCGIMNSG